ncbi:MAG: DUF3006 family protein [Candidatus Gracilibacteria bacterium]|jgi:uncharacterized OB-fold protein
MTVTSATIDANTLYSKLTRFEERYAVLVAEDGSEIRWPIKNLPDQIQIGDSVELKINTKKIAEAQVEDEKYANMRKLLEELIN